MQIFSKDTKWPILAHCDLCPSEYVWCIALNCGESNTKVFVCDECEHGIATLARKGIETRHPLRPALKERNNGIQGRGFVLGKATLLFKLFVELIRSIEKSSLHSHHNSKNLCVHCILANKETKKEL